MDFIGYENDTNEYIYVYKGYFSLSRHF